MKNAGLYLLIAGILIGFLIGLLIPKKIDTSDLENEIKRLKEQVAIKEQALNFLHSDYNMLIDSLSIVKEDYVELALKQEASARRIDSLQSEEVRKGERRYNFPVELTPKEYAATIYGNLALDELSITDDKFIKLEKVNAIQAGIIQDKNQIIKANVDIVKRTRNASKKSGLKTFFAGFGTGSTVTLLLILLL